MSYVNINTLEKVEAVDIMRANPEVSFPNRGWNDEELAPYGYAELWMPTEHPFPETYEKLVEGTPKKIDDKWYIQFNTVPMTEEEVKLKNEYLKSEIINGTQGWLDNFAQTRGYDNILSLTTYATSTDPKFQVEGQYGVQLRDQTWVKIYEILGDVESGVRPMPKSFSEITGELPVQTWPNS